MPKKRALPLSQVYRLLEPGPVVLVSTAGRERPNLMAMSWHTMMEFEPPLVGCVISGRNYSFELLRASKQCVINVPSSELAEKVVGCGNTTGRRVDKFQRFGLTPVAAAKVRAPLVEECFASLECRVADTRLLATYNFFVLEVVQAWIARVKERPRTIHHLGKGTFMFGGETVKLASRAK
jgi:flavin reductase (DIM6/NTAB) family NADH-FMN oxidoreductase RutF